MEMIREALTTIPSLTMVKETQKDNVPSASYPAYDLGWDKQAANPSCTLPPNPSNIHLLPYPIPHIQGHLRDEPSTYQSPPHANYSHYSVASNDQNDPNAFLPHYFTPHQSYSPSLLQRYPRPTPTGYREPSFRLIPQGSTASSRRRRGARAIEYSGLWIDEDELLESLMEPNGKLYVHQCFWEEDRSPCHLWIKSDKSCINAHIQKWHRGRPGGEKLEVDCHWSPCGKRMLKESIARHVLSVHLGEMWECQGCGKGIARKDACGRHVVKADLEGCRTAGALVTYSAEVRVIDARAALESGGRMRYADA